MDSDTELSDDGSFDTPPFPTTCQNVIESIGSLYACFNDRYQSCPPFFVGSLQDACETAFNSPKVEDRRPILIYIHHDRSPIIHLFCKNIFCSEIITDYLLENYIVWPWDITCQSNKNMLMEIWKKLSTQFSPDFSMTQCPMLIGIMRQPIGLEEWLSPYDYECTLLQLGDTLTHFGVKSNREGLLSELMDFKERCDKNEQTFSFDFVKTTGLCWKIFLEITKYPYLDDIIYAFSFNILPFLNKYNAKLHLSGPSIEFINMVLRKSNPQYMVSLHFHDIDQIKE